MGVVSAALLAAVLKHPHTISSSDLAPERKKKANPEEIP